MLSRPNAGYTSITVNDVYVGTASYTDDVPVILMGYFTDILQQHNDDTCVNISLDAEGYSIGLLVFDEYLYAVSNNTDDGLLTHGIMPYQGLDTCVSLARELADDVRMYMDDWVLWDPAVSFDDLGHEVSNTPLMNERKRTLESMADNLESLL